MVGRLPDTPGIRLTAAALLALRDGAGQAGRHRPATRRAGAIPAKQSGSGMDLREIRAYVPGDDPRRMDPAATARTGQPHIRSLHEDRDDTTLLIADFCRPMLWGTGSALRSVRAARHLARTGWQAALRGGSVGVVVVTDDTVTELSLSAGEAHMADIARLLALQHDYALAGLAADGATLSKALARASRLVPSGGRVLLATMPTGWQDAREGLSQLCRRRAVTVALMLDEAEVAAPRGPLAIHDGHLTRLVRMSVPDLGDDTAQLRAMGAIPVRISPEDGDALQPAEASA